MTVAGMGATTDAKSLEGYLEDLARLAVGAHDAQALLEGWNVRDHLHDAAPAGAAMLAAGVPVQVLLDLPAVYCKPISDYVVRAHTGRLADWSVADVARLVEAALACHMSPEATCVNLAGQVDPDAAVELLEAVSNARGDSASPAMPAAYLKAGCAIDDIAWLYALDRMLFTPSAASVRAVGVLPNGDRARLGLLLASRQSTPECIENADRRAGDGHAEVARLLLDGWMLSEALDTGRALAPVRVNRTRVAAKTAGVTR